MAAGDLRISVEGVDALTSLVGSLHIKVDKLLEAAGMTQDQVDALAAKVGTVADRLVTIQGTLTASQQTFATALEGIREDIAALKAQGVDVGSLQANVDRLDSASGDVAAAAGQLGQTASDATSLDEENPPADAGLPPAP